MEPVPSVIQFVLSLCYSLVVVSMVTNMLMSGLSSRRIDNTVAVIPRPRSTRKRAWYVEPVDGSGRMCNHQSMHLTDNDNKVLVGHLFNAAVERENQGLTVGHGEECCISMEPIADSCLPFSDKIHVRKMNPGLTGVELLCGHRFSAVNLLWHWCRSEMRCPMCRAPYSLRSGMACGRSPMVMDGNEEVVRFALVENFPERYWRQLRGIIRVYKQEEEEEERRLIASYHQEAILDETLHTVLGNEPTFFLMLSLENGRQPDIIHYMPLHRTNNNYIAISTDRFNFSVQRSSLRRFTTSMVNAANASVGSTGVLQQYNLMRSSVVMRVGSGEDEHSFLYRLTQLSDIDLPVFRTQQRAALDLELSNVVAATGDTTSVSESMDGHDLSTPPPPPTPPSPPPPPPPLMLVFSPTDTHMLARTSDGISGGISGGISDVVGHIIAAPDLPTVFTAIDSTRTGTHERDSQPIQYRYTTVSSPFVDFAGVLEMEFRESVITEGIDSLLSVFVSLQGCALLNEVARCYSQRTS